MLFVCQINDLSNPIACFTRNENFDPREAYKRGTLLRVIHISLINNHNKSKSNRYRQSVHSELFRHVDQASKFSISHTELTVSRSRDYKHNTASFENAVSKFPRHRFGKGRNMHTDKRIDENYSPRTAISPRLIRERRLRLVASWLVAGGELVGGETLDRIPSLLAGGAWVRQPGHTKYFPRSTAMCFKSAMMKCIST